jgi:hypothetical protein
LRYSVALGVPYPMEKQSEERDVDFIIVSQPLPFLLMTVVRIVKETSSVEICGFYIGILPLPSPPR